MPAPTQAVLAWILFMVSMLLVHATAVTSEPACNATAVLGDCQPIQHCVGLPPAGLASSNGWPSSCSNALYGEKCFAKCQTGYVGGYFALCGWAGWSEVHGACWPSSTGQDLRCAFKPEPADYSWLEIEHWKACENAPDGSTCTANCPPGYVGGFVTFCRHGVWTEPVGSCGASRCFGRPKPEKYGWTMLYAHYHNCQDEADGTVCVAYPCPSWSTGRFVTVCRQGVWSEPFGSCSPTGCVGMPFPDNLNWHMPGEHTYGCHANEGNVCEASCPDGHLGRFISICRHGVWSDAVGSCSPAWCFGKPKPESLIWHAYGDARYGCVTSDGTVCEAPCPSDHVGGLVSMCRHGEWTEAYGVCSPSNCVGLPEPGNYSWHRLGDPHAGCQSSDGFVCEALCPSGYVGSFTSRCRHGVWSEAVGSCKPQSAAGAVCAGKPSSSAPSSTTGWAVDCSGAKEGSYCVAACKEGYIGRVISVCRQGVWSKPFGSCDPSKCSQSLLPDTTAIPHTNPWPQDGSQNGMFDEGVLCRASCHKGYIGGVITQCQHGTWSAVFGSCMPSACLELPPFPTPDNAVSWPLNCAGYSDGGTCRSDCLPGFKGGVFTTCQQGTWTSVIGSCEPFTCLSKPTLETSPYNALEWPSECADREHGYWCDANCAAGFQGLLSATCHDGSWEASCGFKGRACGPGEHEAACGMYGSCDITSGACHCTHDFNGVFCEVDRAAVLPRTECRQVQAAAGAVVYGRPCALGRRKADIPRCQEVQYIPPPADLNTTAFTCPDKSCWVEIVLEGRRGNWLKVSDDCTVPDFSNVATCPAAACTSGACNEALCQATGLCEWASTCLADGKCEVEYRPPGSNCSSGLGTCSEDHTCMIGPCTGVYCGELGRCVDGVCKCPPGVSGDRCELVTSADFAPGSCRLEGCGECGICDAAKDMCVASSSLDGKSCGPGMECKDGMCVGECQNKPIGDSCTAYLADTECTAQGICDVTRACFSSKIVTTCKKITVPNALQHSPTYAAAEVPNKQYDTSRSVCGQQLTRTITNVDANHVLVLKKAPGSSLMADFLPHDQEDNSNGGKVPDMVRLDYASIKRACLQVIYLGSSNMVGDVAWVQVVKNVPPDMYARSGGLVMGWMPVVDTTRTYGEGKPLPLIVYSANAQHDGISCNFAACRQAINPPSDRSRAVKLYRLPCMKNVVAAEIPQGAEVVFSHNLHVSECPEADNNAGYAYVSYQPMQGAQVSGWAMVSPDNRYNHLTACTDCSSCGKYKTHEEAQKVFVAAGVGWFSSYNNGKGCTDPNSSACTSYAGMNRATVKGTVTLKQKSGCPVTVTGGTERGIHSLAHVEGFKADYEPNNCLNTYVTPGKNGFKFIGIRGGDNARQYQSPLHAGVVFAREGDHWDVSYPVPPQCYTPACADKPVTPVCKMAPTPIEGIVWPANCAGKSTCQGRCMAGYIGGPVTVKCNSGAWGSQSGFCSKQGAPGQSLNVKSVTFERFVQAWRAAGSEECPSYLKDEHFRLAYDMLFKKGGLATAGITSVKHLAMFMAHVLVETGCMTLTTEQTCDGDKRYMGKCDEADVCRNNKDCDQKKSYCGRGYLQLTHCYNYYQFQVDVVAKQFSGINVVKNPELVGSNPELRWASAFWFMNKRILGGNYGKQVADGMFGSILCALNANECANGGLVGTMNAAGKVAGYTCSAVRRFAIYRRMLKVLDSSAVPLADGCYYFVHPICAAKYGDGGGSYLSNNAVSNMCWSNRCNKHLDKSKHGVCVDKAHCTSSAVGFEGRNPELPGSGCPDITNYKAAPGFIPGDEQPIHCCYPAP